MQGISCYAYGVSLKNNPFHPSNFSKCLYIIFYRLAEGLEFFNDERKALPPDVITNLVSNIPDTILVAHAQAFWKEVAAVYSQREIVA